MSPAPEPDDPLRHRWRAPARAWRRLPLAARRAVRFVTATVVLGAGSYAAMVAVLFAMFAASGCGLFGCSEPSPGAGLVMVGIATAVGTGSLLAAWWVVRGVRPSRRLAGMVTVALLAVALAAWLFALTGMGRPPGR